MLRFLRVDDEVTGASANRQGMRTINAGSVDRQLVASEVHVMDELQCARKTRETVAAKTQRRGFRSYFLTK